MAHMWYNLAAAQGNKNAVKYRDLVAHKMTQQQIAEAQKLARECLASKYKNCSIVASPLKKKSKTKKLNM